MKPAISNMWVTAQGVARKTNQTILEVFDGNAAATLRKFNVFGPQLEQAIQSSKVGVEETLPLYVNLAFACDCLSTILQPVGVYATNGGKWDNLNLGSLLPVLKPVARLYSDSFPAYRSFAFLTKREIPSFIAAHVRETGFFSPEFEETIWLSLKLCRTASIALQDGRLTDEYIDGILTPLFEKSAQLTGTQHEVGDWRRRNESFFKSMRYIPGSSSGPMSEPNTKPVPAPPPIEKPPQDTKSTDEPAPNQSPPEVLDGALKELERLIGIPSVKEEVKKLTAFLSVQKERQKHGLPTRNQTLHFVFTGNPGTGKTTVARIVAKMLFGFEMLKSAKVVETDRAGLVGAYLGQTALKTDEVINSALDGVLFIDEAYTLSALHEQDMYGKEAISTLLKRMEDHRDRLSVIVAGYPKLMEEFLKTNPGLSSRFTRTISFQDYSVSELGRIFLELCKQSKYELDPNCLSVLSLVLALAYARRDEQFGNARFVRNVFEEVQIRYSQRLYTGGQVHIDKATLVKLAPSDFWAGPLAGIPPTRVAIDKMKWRATCEACKAVHTGNPMHFGRKISCRRCKAMFAFDCWDPVLDGVLLS